MNAVDGISALSGMLSKMWHPLRTLRCPEAAQDGIPEAGAFEFPVAAQEVPH